MNNKKGFTLIELAISITLVSIVLVALVGSLLQLRNAYTVIHENSDVIVYTSSIAKVINSDINDHSGIRYISCNPDGKKCNLILGDDSKRELLITDNSKTVEESNNNKENANVEHTNNKSTLKYVNTTKYDDTNNENDKELLYIRTLELDRYDNSQTHVTTTNGYNFYDMSASQYEYFNDGSSKIDIFSSLVIRLLDGINMDVSKYNIVIYGAGRYDYSSYIGKNFRLEFDTSEADTPGTSVIIEKFGVGFYNEGTTNRIKKIVIPTREDKSFLGYYYAPYGQRSIEARIVDSTGSIIISNMFFKNDVLLSDELTGRIYAKWSDCGVGFNDDCTPEEYTVTLDKNQTGKVCNSEGTNSYTVAYQTMVKDVTIPQCEGHTFEGYFSSSSVEYHSRTGKGTMSYDIADNSTFTARWNACPRGKYSPLTDNECTKCVAGSYTNTTGNGSCTACPAGKTTTTAGSTACMACRNAANVLSWATPVWNTDNTVTNHCKITACKTGYDGKLSENKCVANTYRIIFNLDGGSLGRGIGNDLTATYDQNVTISNPSKTGYDFDGWTFDGNTSTAFHGSTAWTSQLELTKEILFKNLTPLNGGTVTMTAHWTPRVFQITLTNGTDWTCGGAGGSCIQGPTSYIYEKYGVGFYLEEDCLNKMTATSFPIRPPVQPGQYFSGYYTLSTSNGIKFINSSGYLAIDANPEFFTSDGSLYPHWNDEAEI